MSMTIPNNFGASASSQESRADVVVPTADFFNYCENHPVRSPSLTPCHLRLGDCTRFCIFNTKGTLVPEALTLLRTLLDEGTFESIVKLKRITNPRSLPRIDMWVRADLAVHIARAISTRSRIRNLDIVSAFGDRYRQGQSRRPISSWRIVPWQSFQDRAPRPTLQGKSPRATSISFMTLNVNGLRKKYWDVVDALIRQKVAVACLQETLVSREAYPPAVKGYVTYAQPWEDGFRGLAILVDDRCSSYEVPHKLGPGLIHLRVSGLEGINGPVNILGLYMPSGGNYRASRTQFIRDALLLAQRQLDKPNGSRVLLLGDWNAAPERLDKLISSIEPRIARVIPRGSDFTRFSPRSGPKSIDHILSSADMRAYIKRPRVIRRIALSDHRPVVTTIRHNSTEPPVVKKSSFRYDAGMIRKHSQKFVSHNRWAIFADPNEDSSITEIVEDFNSTFAVVSENLGIRRKCNDEGIKFPKGLKKLLQRRKRYDKERTVLAMSGEPVPELLEVKRKRANAAYRKGRKKWVTSQRESFHKRISEDAIAGDTKSVWRTLTSTVGNKIHKNSIVRNGAFHPVMNMETKELVTDLPGVVNEHANHYERITQFDDDGLRDRWEEWSEIEPAEMREELAGINNPLGFQEVLLAIRRMNRNTAPGVDDVHVNVLKALVPEENWLEFLANNPGFTRPDWKRKDTKASELPDTPRTAFGKALFKVLQLTWDNEELPDSWKRVDIVSLLKPGATNPEVLDGYRGISLISVTEKVMLQIMTDRLYTVVEEEKIIVPEQAGFRRREEAIAQVIAVADIVRRRRLAGQSTIGVFVDFKKAYDRVPHGALMYTLARSGVRGKFLRMVNHIYDTSEMSVRLDGVNSRTFRMQRGVRQGCPLSPLLFLLFINSILKDSVPEGVTVPGLGWQSRSRGAMYADDLLCLVETVQQAKQVVLNLEKWCKKWGMELGLSKCGVMLWPWGPNAPTLEGITFRASAGEVPVVTEYKYLGVWLDTSLGDHRAGNSKWGPSLELENSKRRAAEGFKAAHALRPLLTDRHCPISLKTLLIRNLIVPLMTYGAEWTGFRQTHAEPLQRVVNMAIRWVVGVSAKSNTYDYLTLTYELGIPTMEVEMAGRRARLHAKLTTADERTKLQTQIQVLMDKRTIPEVNARLYSWPRSGELWINGLPKGKAMPQPEKKKFGLHVSHRNGDGPFTCSVSGVYGDWEPVWTCVELDEIKALREWLEHERGWEWCHREANNFWYDGPYFTAPTEYQFRLEKPNVPHFGEDDLARQVGRKKAAALEWSDEHLKTLVRPRQGAQFLPMRPWAMRGRIYEGHTRSNEFESEYITSLMELAAGFDVYGIPIGDGIVRDDFLLEGVAPSPMNLKEEWDALLKEGMTAKGDQRVRSVVHNVQTRLLERQFDCCKTEGFRWYNHWGFGATRDFIRHTVSDPNLTEGVRWLISIRCRAFPRIGEAIVRAKRMGRPCALVPNRCPLCSTYVDHGWEWAHLLVNCTHQICCAGRTAKFERLISSVEASICVGLPIDLLPLNAGVSDWTRPRLGAVAIYLVGGVVNDSFDCSAHLGFGHLPLSVHLDGLDHGVIWPLTASFLQTVAPLYASYLGSLPDQGMDYTSDGTQVAEIGNPPYAED